MFGVHPEYLLGIAVGSCCCLWTAAVALFAFRLGLDAGYRKSRDLPPGPALPRLSDPEKIDYSSLDDLLPADEPFVAGAEI